MEHHILGGLSEPLSVASLFAIDESERSRAPIPRKPPVPGSPQRRSTVGYINDK